MQSDSKFESLDIETDTLDNMLTSLELNKFDWIKIDVQGAEVLVLNGAKKIIANSDNLKLIIEIHEEKYGKPIKEMLTNLDFNYKIFPRPTHPTNYHLFASRNS